MFQPSQAALMAWTSASILGNVLRDPDIHQPEQAIVRYSAREEVLIRELALVAGFAILLLVLAIFLLATGSTASAFAVLAVLPVFRNLARSNVGSPLAPEPDSSVTPVFRAEGERVMTEPRLIFQWRRTAPLVIGVLFMATQLLVVNAAVSPVTEEIVSTQELAGFPNPLSATRSQVSFASASSWRTDPDHEIVTLVVTRGVLEVRLEAGSARIDRHAPWLADTARGPSVSGLPAKLATGDRLVVMDGYLLTVTNRHDSPASAVVYRVRRE